MLDLRGLTFMDVSGLRELLRQNEFARSNRHNLAVVRGTDAIQRILRLTGVEDMLVLVDDPEDLVPPPSRTSASSTVALREWRWGSSRPAAATSTPSTPPGRRLRRAA